MSAIEFTDLLRKCDNDAEKFMSHVASVLEKETNFFEDSENKLQIWKKYFEHSAAISMKDAIVSTTNGEENQPDDAIAQKPADKVNEVSMNNSIGGILVATQYSTHENSSDENSCDNLIIDETAASGWLNEESLREQNIDGAEYDDNEIIPETQYAPDQVSTDGESRPISRTSSHNSFGHGANDKHVQFAMDVENLMNLVEAKNSINGGGSDEGDELIDVNQDTNGSWTTISDDHPIDESQAVIGHLDAELLADVGSSACHNDRLTDSISLSSTYVGNASKDAEALNMPAAKSNGKIDAMTTGRPEDPNANTSCREAERSTSTTPDLDMFSTPMEATSMANALSTSNKARTSTPDSFAARASQANKVSVAPSDIDGRSSTPDLFVANTSQENNNSVAQSIADERSSTPDLIMENPSPEHKLSSVVDTSAATLNDDSCSNDNELFGACTQVFPPPRQVTINQAANISSASELNDEESDNHPLESNQTTDATVAVVDGKSLENDKETVDNVVDENEDSNDIYAAQTQMYPLAPAPPSSSRVGERVVAMSGNNSKANSPNTSKNGEMRPPDNSRKSKSKTTSKGNRSAENDPFAALTQEFHPFPVASSKTPATVTTDAIYDLETQIMTPRKVSAKQTRQSHTDAVVDSEDIWPCVTPQTSIVANVSLSDIRKNYELSSKKSKTKLKKKWLFESQEDSESDSEEKLKSPSKKMLKSGRDKRKADKVETVTSESAKKIRTNQPTADDSPLSSVEMAQIQKRRVSVVLERLQIDVNSNVSPASENDEKSSKVTKRSMRQAKSNKNTDRSVSDATPNRATRASKRTKVVGASFDASKGRSSTRSEIARDESSDSRSTSRSSSRNAGALVAASSSDLPLIRLETRTDTRAGNRSASSVQSRRSSRSNTRSVSSVESRSNTRSANSVESRPNGRTGDAPSHRIMFTKVNMERRELKSAMKAIQKMGGEVVDCPTECTVLVCEKVYRTYKMMSAVGRGIPIVTPEWLLASKLQTHFVDTEPYQVQDADNEKRFDFNLKTSLEKARKRSLYENYLVFITPNIIPPPKEIAMIVECGGGTCSIDFHKEFSSKLKKLAVSSTTDASQWKKIRALHPGIPIISTECLMRNVMQQKIDFDGYKLCK